jgi:uncharacterized membrane protein YphA (DoxX/SURF4 family)
MHKIYKKIRSVSLFYILLLLPTLLPSNLEAHVKWFAENTETIKPYSITDWQVILGILIFILIVLLGIYLQKRISVSNRLHETIEKLAPTVLSLASMGIGLASIIFSLNGFIFAPNLTLDGTLGMVILVIQAIAGIMMLFGIYERVAGFIVIFLFALGIYEYGAVEMLDTLEIIGFALYVIIVGRPKWKIIDSHSIAHLTHRIHSYGYPLLRVFTGLNLIILGFSEKILAPGLTANFLHSYDWNFMQHLGIGFYTNYWFAFSAGMTEILLGVFFVFGLITRITTVFLAIFLVITLSLLGPVELIGHLPHFSLAIILLVLGSGSRLVLKHADREIVVSK